MSTDTIEVSQAEQQIGKALALIHRVLPQVNTASRAGEVQAALKMAASLLQSAAGCAANPSAAPADITPEVLAAITAAVTTALGPSYRIVSVNKIKVPIAPATAWVNQGRNHIYQSHILS
jgi:type II secretory pathway pseudopilin PulG